MFALQGMFLVLKFWMVVCRLGLRGMLRDMAAKTVSGVLDQDKQNWDILLVMLHGLLIHVA